MKPKLPLARRPGQVRVSVPKPAQAAQGWRTPRLADPTWGPSAPNHRSRSGPLRPWRSAEARICPSAETRRRAFGERQALIPPPQPGPGPWPGPARAKPLRERAAPTKRPDWDSPSSPLLAARSPPPARWLSPAARSPPLEKGRSRLAVRCRVEPPLHVRMLRRPGTPAPRAPPTPLASPNPSGSAPFVPPQALVSSASPRQASSTVSRVDQTTPYLRQRPASRGGSRAQAPLRKNPASATSNRSRSTGFLITGARTGARAGSEVEIKTGMSARPGVARRTE